MEKNFKLKTTCSSTINYVAKAYVMGNGEFNSLTIILMDNIPSIIVEKTEKSHLQTKYTESKHLADNLCS